MRFTKTCITFQFSVDLHMPIKSRTHSQFFWKQELFDLSQIITSASTKDLDRNDYKVWFLLFIGNQAHDLCDFYSTSYQFGNLYNLQLRI